MPKKLMHAIIKSVKSKNKNNMNKKDITASKKLFSSARRPAILSVALMFGLFVTVSTFVYAETYTDQYQEKIDKLNSNNEQITEQQGILSVQADSLSDAINKLQGQINASQARIDDLNNQIEKLRQQIKETEIELAKQKELLGVSIKSMYVNGEISTVEMLATSSDLGDFFDQQQYQENVRDKIKTTLDKVTQLKLDLNSKKEKVTKSLEEQKGLQTQLASQKAEKNRVLSLNQSQQNKLEEKIRDNNSEISRLKAEQAAAYAAYLARNSSAMYGVGEAGNGGYPSVWANAPLDSMLDTWGMYNRECVSYVAWKVASTGKFMPGWGNIGIGNAYQWINNSRYGTPINGPIPIDKNPTVGSVAVWDSGDGLSFLGHVAYVEVVNSDGSIEVSQYNFTPGQFSRMHVSASEVQILDFIHFQ